MSIKDDWQKFSIGEKIIFAVGTALIPMLAVLILFLYSIAFKSEIASAKRYAKNPSKILAAIRKALKPKKTQNSRTYRRKSRNKCNLYHRANGRIVLPTNTVFNCVRSSGCPYGCYQHYNQIGYNYASPQECKRAQISCINRICGHLCE